MRKVLFIALGLAGLTSAQPAFAGAGQACVQIARQLYHSSGDQCATGDQYLSFYRQCLNDPQGAKTAAAEQKQQQRAANPGPGVTARGITAPSTTRHNQ